ncbi:hypothetical protein WA026_010994 [Henosepilachna vigintioctopunctata]|uniref:Uncharacterized protein n=1 Tax=Henosepilachna vigintioctopunctata TaxID=420089 RepID=A0AAW1UXD1_9CUCU
MFNEMKIYLEDKLCSCKSKDLNVVTSNAESRTSKRQSLPLEAEGIEISEIQTKSKSFETDVPSKILSDKVSTTMDKKSNFDDDSDTETMKKKTVDEIAVHSNSHNELNNSIEQDTYLNINEKKPPQNFSMEKIAQYYHSNDDDKIETSKNNENKNDDDDLIANNSLDQIGIMTTKKSNDDNELIDNKNSEGKEITRSSDEIIQYQQEVTEGDDMLKAQRGSSIINENELTLPQTFNDKIGDENKLLLNSNTGSLKMSNQSGDALEEERMVASRNSGISEQDNLDRVSKKETFESQAKPSIGISQNLETVDKKKLLLQTQSRA